jgi:hypothetical protein
MPKAFALRVRGDDISVKITDILNRRADVSQGGIFDPNLFCDGHEKSLNALDDYAVRLSDELSEVNGLTSGKIFYFHQANGTRLAKFAYSVLLRCHYSRRRETSVINIGHYADLLSRIIFEDSNEVAPNVCVYLPLSDIIDVRELMSLPAGRKFTGFRRWSFLCGGMNFLVGLGKVASPLREYNIHAAEPMPLIGLDFHTSGASGHWMEMVASSNGKLGPF